MVYSTIGIAAGCALDLIIGDPHSIPHPVSAIGKLIAFCERKLLRGGDAPAAKRRKGFLMCCVIVAFCAAAPLAVLSLMYRFNAVCGAAVESIMCFQILAVKSLRVESMKVKKALDEGSLKKARRMLSMIVGRDTERLDEEGVARAAIETVAENTTDGVIAPLFYMMIGGPVLGFVYKGINTMDSMVGYKNEKYADFGRFAAKLDDAANFIPSRIAAALMIISSFILKYDAKNAYKIFKRDRSLTLSPNAGQTEAVCAGALRIGLLGDAYYSGRLVKKPVIGDPKRAPQYYDIVRANKMMYCSAIVMEIIAAAARGFFILNFGA